MQVDIEITKYKEILFCNSLYYNCSILVFIKIFKKSFTAVYIQTNWWILNIGLVFIYINNTII